MYERNMNTKCICGTYALISGYSLSGWTLPHGGLGKFRVGLDPRDAMIIEANISHMLLQAPLPRHFCV